LSIALSKKWFIGYRFYYGAIGWGVV